MNLAFQSLVTPLYHHHTFGSVCKDKSFDILTKAQYAEVVEGDLDSLITDYGTVIKIKDMTTIALASQKLTVKVGELTEQDRAFATRILPVLNDLAHAMPERIQGLSDLPKAVAIKTEASLNKLINYFTL